MLTIGPMSPATVTLVHRELAIRIDADFGDFGEVAGVTEMEREAQAATLRQLLAPAGFLRCELDDRRGATGVQRELVVRLQPARLAHEVEQELQVIALRRDRQLVQEALHREGDRAGTRRAPRTGRNLQRQLRLREADVRHEQRGELFGDHIARQLTGCWPSA